MKRVLFAIGISYVLLSSPLPAGACHGNPTCTAGTFINGSNTYVCDKQCFTATDCATAGTFANCDQCGAGEDNGSPDGKCVICNVGGHAATMSGTSGDDVICGGSLADTINGNGGDDIIQAGDGDDTIDGGGGYDEISGGYGNDDISGGTNDDIIIDGAGNNYVDGGANGDTLWTGAGDDEIHGGAGDDLLIGGSGSDYLDGGDDDDVVSAVVYGTTTVPDDVLGSRYCGGPGNDNLQGRGPGHQCMDGGEGTDTCGYAFWVTTRSATSLDIGTGTNCESKPGVVSTREPSCACP